MILTMNCFFCMPTMQRYEVPHPWRQGDGGWRKTLAAVADAVTTALASDGRRYCLLVVSGQGPGTGKTFSTDSIREHLSKRWTVSPNRQNMSSLSCYRPQNWSDRDVGLRILYNYEQRQFDRHLDTLAPERFCSTRNGLFSAIATEPLKQLLILEGDQLPFSLKDSLEHIGEIDESSVTIVRLDIA